MAKPSWITLSKSSGTGSSSVSVTASSNPDTSDRSGSISISTTSGLSKSVSLSQEASEIRGNLVSVNISGYTNDSNRNPYASAKCQYAAASSLSVTIQQNVTLYSGGSSKVMHYVTIPKGSTTSNVSTDTDIKVGTILSSSVALVTPTEDSTYRYTW